ncbi:hypothetical protein SAMN05216436_12182 [bacterium A37T11]|nr:hypothetical protein SAMN05216436_12182 [bacterium A37T11]
MAQSATRFKEIQRFRQWWLWVLLLGLDAYMIFKLYRLAEKETVTTVYIIPVVIVLLITLLFATARLSCVIKEDGVYLRFFPFHFRTRFYSWEQLRSVQVRQYNPLAEYGGWGVRIGINGWAYNVSGNWGIQLIPKKRVNILIGTQMPEEARQILQEVMPSV